MLAASDIIFLIFYMDNDIIIQVDNYIL